jgi:deoxycytidylate deaminase
MKRKEISDSQFMDALEYGRIVHAEMSAISDAARNGRAIKDTVLYSTTFPCHMCAKHIVAAGIAKVIFLEPYPKSLASDLHSDSIEIENSDRGQYDLPQNWWTPIIRSILTVEVFYENEENIYGRVQG